MCLIRLALAIIAKDANTSAALVATARMEIPDLKFVLLMTAATQVIVIWMS